VKSNEKLANDAKAVSASHSVWSIANFAPSRALHLRPAIHVEQRSATGKSNGPAAASHADSGTGFRSSQTLRANAIRSAIRFTVYQCFSCTFVPSVALHVVEFTFLGGFESLPLRQTV
jgi:hypothetical protein